MQILTKHNHVDVESSEMDWFYRKAMLNFQSDLAQEILLARDAKHAKRLGKRIRCALDWDTSPLASRVMEEILIDKFTQVESCGEFLRETHRQNLKLVEAVPTSDTLWGSGLDREGTLNSDQDKWPGQNKLGKLLESVRSHLFDEGWSDDEAVDKAPMPNDLPSPPQGGEGESTKLNEVESTQQKDDSEQISNLDHSVPSPVEGQSLQTLDISNQQNVENDNVLTGSNSVKAGDLDRVILKASSSPRRPRSKSPKMPKRNNSPRSKSIKRSQNGSSPVPTKQSRKNLSEPKLHMAPKSSNNEGRKVSSETGVS